MITGHNKYMEFFYFALCIGIAITHIIGVRVVENGKMCTKIIETFLLKTTVEEVRILPKAGLLGYYADEICWTATECCAYYDYSALPSLPLLTRLWVWKVWCCINEQMCSAWNSKWERRKSPDCISIRFMRIISVAYFEDRSSGLQQASICMTITQRRGGTYDSAFSQIWSSRRLNEFQ